MELIRVLLLGAWLLVALLEISNALSTGDKSGIEWCESKRNFMKASVSTCKLGFEFGKRTPPCICTKGIHRIHYGPVSCSVEDRFADKLCSKSKQDKGKIIAIQIIAEPDWKNTHVVYENRNAYSSTSWDINSLPSSGKARKISTNGKDFYTINGLAYFMTDTQSICVQREKSLTGSAEICRFYKEDNPVWTADTIEIEMTTSAAPCSSHSAVKLLNSRTCSAPLNSQSSECELECIPQAENGTEGKDCSPADEAIMFDNNFLDRRMAQHAMMMQLYQAGPVAMAQPNRTFDLFMRMVNITRGYCPNDYVPTSWVKHLTELFYVLHKGREFQYEEVLSEDDFNWIRDILDRCEAKQNRVNLTNGAGQADSSCEADHVGGRAWGYCKDTSCKNKIQILPIPEKAGMKLKNKHYIPELAWNVIDATQAICFHEFRASYRMFHVLEQASEKLFTPEIRHLWYNPPYRRDPKRKARLVGPGSDESMHNMEICIGSAYHITNEANKRRKKDNEVTLIPRLVRPPEAKHLRRKKRSAVDKARLGKFIDISCADTKLPVCNNQPVVEPKEMGEKAFSTGNAQNYRPPDDGSY